MYENKLHKSKSEASRMAEAFAAFLDESRLVFLADASEALIAVKRLFAEDYNQAAALYHTFVDRWSLRTTADAMGVKSHATVLLWNRRGITLLNKYVEVAREEAAQITPVSPTTANEPS